MTDVPSFDELKNNCDTWIDLRCTSAVINESSCGLPYTETIDSYFCYECVVTGCENSAYFNSARVRILEIEQNVLENQSSKYPFGFFSIENDVASITLNCTSKQIGRMISNLNLLTENHIGFTLTIPEFSDELPKYIPILGYVYRAKVNTNS